MLPPRKEHTHSGIEDDQSSAIEDGRKSAIGIWRTSTIDVCWFLWEDCKIFFRKTTIEFLLTPPRYSTEDRLYSFQRNSLDFTEQFSIEKWYRISARFFWNFVSLGTRISDEWLQNTRQMLTNGAQSRWPIYVFGTLFKHINRTVPKATILMARLTTKITKYMKGREI